MAHVFVRNIADYSQYLAEKGLLKFKIKDIKSKCCNSDVIVTGNPLHKICSKCNKPLRDEELIECQG